jgi:hypothetical protein
MEVTMQATTPANAGDSVMWFVCHAAKPLYLSVPAIYAKLTLLIGRHAHKLLPAD